MAKIVLVHGIAQQQKTADVLERDWIPPLAGGLRIIGHPEYADRMWRAARPGDLDVRMAFYGDYFLREDQQGEPDTHLPPDAQAVFDTLLAEWAGHIAVRGTDPRDRRAGELALADLHGRPDQQGLRSGLRSVLNTLSRIRPLAKFSTHFAGTVLRTALAQVSLYLTDDALRERVQARVAEHLGPDTVAVIGHSLGSVVAYEALHHHPYPLPVLITLGSPLGVRNVVYERTRPQPPAIPPMVRRWINVADRDDLVAASHDLTTRFPGPDGILEHTYTVDNGAHPHDATFYLAKKTVATAVAQALEPAGDNQRAW